jgi:cyclohexadieny/prephenate dehydrogenase
MSARSSARDRAVAPHIPEGVHFVPGHPLAGTEHSGPASGFAELFDNRWTS